MGLKELFVDIQGVGETPCERYTCGNLKACADEKLCCDAFIYFVKTGAAKSPYMRIPERISRRIQPELMPTIVATREKFEAMERE